MIEIEKPSITTVDLSEDGKSGKFIVESLERGFGTTLGNSQGSFELTAWSCCNKH